MLNGGYTGIVFPDSLLRTSTVRRRTSASSGICGAVKDKKEHHLERGSANDFEQSLTRVGGWELQLGEPRSGACIPCSLAIEV